MQPFDVTDFLLSINLRANINKIELKSISITILIAIPKIRKFDADPDVAVTSMSAIGVELVLLANPDLSTLRK